MPKNLIFVIALVTIVLAVVFTLVLYTRDGEPSKVEVDSAINQARLLYRQEKTNRRDLSNGPCLSDALLPGWVLDIVHNPRQPIDDLPENQCPSYVEGRSEHMVELDLDGNLMRVK